jgi:hypothetical protein
VISISSVPIPGIAAINRASARQFIVAYRVPVRLACADHEVSNTALAHFAFDGAVKEAVLQPIDDDSFKLREGLSELPVIASARCCGRLRFIHCCAAPS